MPRRLVRIAAAIVAAPLVLAATLALAWPWLRPVVVARVLDRIERIADAELAVSSPRLTLGWRNVGISAAEATLERGAVLVRCVDLRASGGMLDLLRGGPIESMHVARCTIASTASTSSATATDSGEAALIPDPGRLLDAAHALRDHLGVITVDTVDIERSSPVDEVVDVVADFGVRPARVEFEVVRGDRRGSVRVELWQDRLSVRTEHPVPIGALNVTVGLAEIDRHGVLALAEPSASGAFGGANLTISTRRVTVDGPRARPRVVIESPIAAVDRPRAQTVATGSSSDQPVDAAEGSHDSAAEAEAAAADPESPLDGRPQAGVPVGAALDALVARVAALIAHADRAASAALPDVDLSVNNAQIELIDGWTIHLPSFHWDGEGRAVGELAAGAVRGSFDVELRRARHAHLAIEGVELADLLPAGAPFAGTTGVAAEVKLEPAGAVAAITLSLRDVSITLPGVAALPMTDIDADLTLGAGVTVGAAPSIRFEASGTINAVPLDFALHATSADGAWVVDASGGLREEVACNTVWQALPEALIPNLGRQGVNFDGAAQLRLAVRWALDDPQSFELSASGFPGTCTIDRIRRGFDPRILNDDSYVHHVIEGVTRDDIFVGPGTDSYVRLADLPSYVPAVMYLSEEIGFYSNPGISIGLMNRGMRLNIERSRYAYGGSTVSQQLVKNLFLTRSKTLSRKLEEAVIVWAMETWVEKDRILELYINCIEYGPDIYGLRNAAFHYFGRGPETLTPLEAAWLANLKPSPISGGRYLQRGHSAETGWWPERLAELLRRLHVYGAHITPEEAAYYAPYVVALPMSPNAATSPYRPVPRPAWAATDTFRVFHRSQPDAPHVPETAPP